MTRRSLRENIFRILFKVEFNSLEEMDEQIEFSIDDIEKITDEEKTYIIDKTKAIIGKQEEIDEIIAANSNGWNIGRIGKAELAIMRLAIYEMKYDEDIPYKVAINEAIELTKLYCNEDTKSFVNGVLAQIKE